MGGQEYLICLLSCQTLPCLQNTGIQDEETAEHYTMSVNEDEERDISKEIKHQQDTCPVKTLATVSLSVSLTALVISCVFGTLVIVRYFSPEANDDKIPDLCRLPPDPGPCSSSVNRQVIILHGHVVGVGCHEVLIHTKFVYVSDTEPQMSSKYFLRV